MLNVKSLTASAVVLGLTLGAAVSIAAAQQSGNQTGQPESGMMGNRGGGMMGDRGGGMMGMMGVDTAQMNRMIENCNRFMESMMQTPPTTSSPPATPTPEKHG